MTQKTDQFYEPKLPNANAGKNLRDSWVRRREANFRNFIRKQPLVEFYQMAPWNEDEPESIGIQWYSGCGKPSWLYGYPDQAYWKTYSLILMFRNKRWCVTIRGNKMPYRNYDRYAEWMKGARGL